MPRQVVSALAVAMLVASACTPERVFAPPTRRAPNEAALTASAPSGDAERAPLVASARDGDRCREPSPLRSRIEHAADGLLYTSESDYPFDWTFYCDAPSTAASVSVGDLRRLAGIAPDARVEEQTLDAFFARHIERADPNDPTAQALVPRYRHLKRVVRNALTGVRVYRVGTVAVRCYVVGRDAHGNVVGLQTTSIET